MSLVSQKRPSRVGGLEGTSRVCVAGGILRLADIVFGISHEIEVGGC